MFAATNTHTFVATKYVFCRDKHDKHVLQIFVATKVFRDKHIFVATKIILVAAPADDSSLPPANARSQFSARKMDRRTSWTECAELTTHIRMQLAQRFLLKLQAQEYKHMRSLLRFISSFLQTSNK